MAGGWIYLDHNATTPQRPEVIDEVARVSRAQYGNPGSRHVAGRGARQVLESARERMAALLGARPAEVIFTSGGTESINLAVRGLCGAGPGIVVAPAGEHPATEESLAALEEAGQRRVALRLDADGLLDAGGLEEIDWPQVRLATLLLAHNETGVVQDVGPLAERCRLHGVPLHVDAVQAVGKLPTDFRALGATALSLGAHKFGGPRGVGALLLREGVRLAPLLRGGHQERERRAGTECVALAAGMALALELWERERDAITTRLTSLRERLLTGLTAACGPVQLIGHPTQRLPNTLNLAFAGCDGEALLVALDLAGVCCSLGSTCSSGSTEPAAILAAMGVPQELHRSCLRLSLGWNSTAADVDGAIERIALTVGRLRAGR